MDQYLPVTLYDTIVKKFKDKEVCLIACNSKPYIKSLDGTIIKEPLSYDVNDYRGSYFHLENAKWLKCKDIVVKIDKGNIDKGQNYRDCYIALLLEYNDVLFTAPIYKNELRGTNICRINSNLCLEGLKYDDLYNITTRNELEKFVKLDSDTRAEEEKLFAIREQERKVAEQKKKAALIAKYGDKYGVAVANEKVMIGMTREMCRDAWGRPVNITKKTTTLGSTEVWAYGYKTFLTFNGDKLVEIIN